MKTEPPVQIKSRKRVKDFAEVFTAAREVEAMLDLLPDIGVQQTFLEPACGNGAFLTAVLKRKLALCRSADEVQTAYASLYGIDIQADNAAETRTALLALLPEPYRRLRSTVEQIMQKNIVCGDFLQPATVPFLKGLL